MSWTYEEIERNWLAGNLMAVAPELVVAAFARCERLLGREWIEARRYNAPGTLPTLNVVGIGLALGSLDDVADTQQLVGKLRREDQSASAELRAIHLLRSRGPTQVELEPIVHSGGRQRKCDFRIQKKDGPCVYVEVTQPDMSEAHTHAQSLLEAIIAMIAGIEKPFALEVFLRREPSDDEVPALTQRAREFCSAGGEQGIMVKQELPEGMGLLLLNQGPVGQVVLNDHEERPVPRLGASRAVIGPGAPNRHVVVRMPYADERAEQSYH
jgi:hypothetical protein